MEKNLKKLNSNITYQNIVWANYVYWSRFDQKNSKYWLERFSKFQKEGNQWLAKIKSTADSYSKKLAVFRLASDSTTKVHGRDKTSWLKCREEESKARKVYFAARKARDEARKAKKSWSKEQAFATLTFKR